MNILSQFKLNDYTAVVTGGGRGLGKSMAEALASAGSNVIIVDKNKKLAEKSARELKKYGIETLAISIDITAEKKVIDMVSQIKGKFDSVDILLNNAGISFNKPIEKTDLENWQKVLNVNLTGMFLCSREIGKVMVEQKSGSIINIASMSGLIVNWPQPQAAYNTSKAGVIQLTKSLAAEWAEHNIRVNAIAPGYMKTKMTKEFIKDSPKIKQEWIDSTPLQRMGEPEELRGAVVYLASSASSFMTGNTLVIDGGYCVL